MINYRAELELYAKHWEDGVKSWYTDWQRPNELQKRIKSLIPSSITSFAAFVVFPKTSIATALTTAITPEAVERIFHNINNKIDALDMTPLEKKVNGIACAIILLTLSSEYPFLQIPPALMSALVVGNMVYDNYWTITLTERKQGSRE